MNENIKTGIRNWLQVDKATPIKITITENIDRDAHAIRNRIWYRGDSNELTQLYSIVRDYADQWKFWAANSSKGMEIRKIHTGLPGLMVKTLCGVVLPDMNAPKFERPEDEDLWSDIDKENNLEEMLKDVLTDTLVVGDGAIKITFDTSISRYPILEWYPGDRIDITRKRKRITEITFKTPYKVSDKEFTLLEHYGRGYVDYELIHDGKSVPLDNVPEFATLQPVRWNGSTLLAVPIMIYKSAKWEGRGASIFDGKLDNFDALDEAWSQWMQALRDGRSKRYIPESLVPKDPYTGAFLTPNPFDNQFIVTEGSMSEGANPKIATEQAAIPHDSYEATYITALDLCLQGILSPSTLGIDTKKLDNAEAQREKEKTTLYTRNSIIEALAPFVQKVIETAIASYMILNNQEPAEVKVDVGFGEYANPSFESQVETIAKGKQGGIMSIEASVEELYGDTKSDEWKQEEVQRLKMEQGIATVEEPALNTEGVIIDEGTNSI